MLRLNYNEVSRENTAEIPILMGNLGFDIGYEPSTDKLVVFEVNGIESGLAGATQLGLTLTDFYNLLSLYDPTIILEEGYGNGSLESDMRKSLEKYEQIWQRTEVHLNQIDFPFPLPPSIKRFFSNPKDSKQKDNSIQLALRQLLNNVVYLEHILNNKQLTYELFVNAGLADFIPFTIQGLTPENFQCIKSLGRGLVVVKHPVGRQGRQVFIGESYEEVIAQIKFNSLSDFTVIHNGKQRIFPLIAKQAAQTYSEAWQLNIERAAARWDMLTEELIHSFNVYFTQLSHALILQQHVETVATSMEEKNIPMRTAIRYVVQFEMMADHKLSIHHFGGYERRSNSSLIVNLHNGATPAIIPPTLLPRIFELSEHLTKALAKQVVLVTTTQSSGNKT